MVQRKISTKKTIQNNSLIFTKFLRFINRKKSAEETEDPNYWAIQKGIDVPYMLLHKKHCSAYKRCVLMRKTKYISLVTIQLC